MLTLVGKGDLCKGMNSRRDTVLGYTW